MHILKCFKKKGCMLERDGILFYLIHVSTLTFLGHPICTYTKGKEKRYSKQNDQNEKKLNLCGGDKARKVCDISFSNRLLHDISNTHCNSYSMNDYANNTEKKNMYLCS